MKAQIGEMFAGVEVASSRRCAGADGGMVGGVPFRISDCGLRIEGEPGAVRPRWIGPPTGRRDDGETGKVGDPGVLNPASCVLSPVP